MDAHVQPAFDLGVEAPAKTPRKRIPKPVDRKLSEGGSTKRDVIEIVAALPPRIASSPEEIAARREARRARIANDKAEGRRDSRGRPVKHRAADIILRMTASLDDGGKPRGASMAELVSVLGWKAPTIRSYIGGVLRKRGHDIRVALTKGQPRRYQLAPKGRRGPKAKTFALRGKAGAE